MSANKIFMFLIKPPSGNVKRQNIYCGAFEKRKEEDRKKINTLLISHLWSENFVVCNLSYLELADKLFIV